MKGQERGTRVRKEVDRYMVRVGYSDKRELGSRGLGVRLLKLRGCLVVK